MRFRKFFNLFCLIILSIISLITTSCKEGVVDPHFTVLTTDNLVKLQAAADKAITSVNTPGLAAYISVEGEGELYITRGVSNLATNEPMNPSNYFRMASITKTFTTEAVLILSDEGNIDIEKPISFYLPELNIPSGDKITVKMLANMTSGLYDFGNDESATSLYGQWINSKGEKIVTPEEIVAEALKHPLNFTPGSKFEYSNTGSVLLGLVIKKVTGKTVAQVFIEKIFQPLGMQNTFWPISRFLPYPFSHGYNLVSGSLADVTNWNPSIADASGILISNLSDLKIWAKEIYEGKLLSDKSKKERIEWVAQNRASDPGQWFYSFGLMKVHNWIGHGGNIHGYNSMAFYHPEKKITLIVTTNSEDSSPAQTAFQVFATILGAW